MSDATFACPDLTTFCRLDELGLEVIGQRLEPDRAVLACRVVEPDQWCRRCGCEGTPADTVIRRLAHEPLGWRPTTAGGHGAPLPVHAAAGTCGARTPARRPSPRAKLSRRGLRWALEGIVVAHLTVARVAEGLGVAWNTANDAVLAEGKRVLIDDPARFDGVTRDRRRRARLAPHPPRRQVRHRDHRPDRHPRRHRPGPAAGHGRGPLQAGVQDLARRPRRRPGATRSRSSRWTGSPGSRPPPPRSCPTRSR